MKDKNPNLWINSLKDLVNAAEPTYVFTVSNISILAHVLCTAKKLKINEYIYNKDLSVEELAKCLGIHNISILKKLLRILSCFGFIDCTSENKYKANSTTNQFQYIDPTFIGEKAELALCNLSESVITGKPAFDITYGQSFYDMLNNDKVLSNSFDEWNHRTAEIWIYPLIQHYNFSRFNTIVDLGGGTGAFIAKVLQKNNSMRGILFDRESVANNARDFLNGLNILDRCSIVGGNIFDTVPSGGDIYCINRVLLNMSDEEAARVLKNCRSIIKKDALLIIIDIIMPDPESPMYSNVLLNDLRLYSLMRGYHRNKSEWENILKLASFSISSILFFDKVSPFSIIEAYAT